MKTIKVSLCLHLSIFSHPHLRWRLEIYSCLHLSFFLTPIWQNISLWSGFENRTRRLMNELQCNVSLLCVNCNFTFSVFGDKHVKSSSHSLHGNWRDKLASSLILQTVDWWAWTNVTKLNCGSKILLILLME